MYVSRVCPANYPVLIFRSKSVLCDPVTTCSHRASEMRGPMYTVQLVLLSVVAPEGVWRLLNHAGREWARRYAGEYDEYRQQRVRQMHSSRVD